MTRLGCKSRRGTRRDPRENPENVRERRERTNSASPDKQYISSDVELPWYHDHRRAPLLRCAGYLRPSRVLDAC